MIRLVIIDDHAMLLEGMTLALEREHDIQIVGTAQSCESGLATCTQLQPDVVVLDYRIGSESGAELARDLRSNDPSITLVGMSAMSSRVVVDDMVDAGCVSFVHKQRGIAALANAIRAAHDGIGHLPSRVAIAGGNRLTHREVEVLQLMSEGEGPTEIAEQLHLSVHTVRNHIRQIRRKFGVTSQLAAVAAGIRSGLISGPERT